VTILVVEQAPVPRENQEALVTAVLYRSIKLIVTKNEIKKNNL
jgi:hypothetical protein